MNTVHSRHSMLAQELSNRKLFATESIKKIKFLKDSFAIWWNGAKCNDYISDITIRQIGEFVNRRLEEERKSFRENSEKIKELRHEIKKIQHENALLSASDSKIADRPNKHGEILSKAQFVELMKIVQHSEQYMSNVEECIGKAFGIKHDANEIECVVLPTPKFVTELISFLKKSMHDDTNESWIDYFIYELDYGKKAVGKEVAWKSGGTPIPLSTAEELYDALIDDIQ